MTTVNLHLHQMHLPSARDLYHRLPWLLTLQNLLYETGQVLCGALHLMPVPPAGLNQALRQDLDIQ